MGKANQNVQAALTAGEVEKIVDAKLSEFEDKIKAYQDVIDELRKQVSFQQGIIDTQKTEINYLSNNIDDLNQYGRKNDVILSNMTPARHDHPRSSEITPAIPAATPGESPRMLRDIICKTINERLDLAQVKIKPSDLSACHRLGQTDRVIVRFMDGDHKQLVYRARTKPKVRGLLVFENLSKGRSATIRELSQLRKQNRISKFWTLNGDIFVIPHEQSSPIKLKTCVSLTRQQILDQLQNELERRKGNKTTRSASARDGRSPVGSWADA